MLKRLREVLGLCPHHKWEIIEQGNLVNHAREATGRWYMQQCTACGKLKYVSTR